nr:MAG TPA: hypothetical protein [Caudoviricetes sp.]
MSIFFCRFVYTKRHYRGDYPAPLLFHELTIKEGEPIEKFRKTI